MTKEELLTKLDEALGEEFQATLDWALWPAIKEHGQEASYGSDMIVRGEKNFVVKSIDGDLRVRNLKTRRPKQEIVMTSTPDEELGY